MFLNIIMKDGKKYLAYKIMYGLLFKIKKLTGFQPIRLLKYFFSKQRLLFDKVYLKLKKKTIMLPKLLSVRKQITLTLKYILNNFKKFYKRDKTFLENITKIILFNLFVKKKNLKRIIRKDSTYFLKKFYLFRNMEDSNKIKVLLRRINNKPRLFKVKFKSLDKRKKYLSKYVRNLTKLKKNLYSSKFDILDTYRMNIQSRSKLINK